MLEECRIIHVESGGILTPCHSFSLCQNAEICPPVPPLTEMIVQLGVAHHGAAEKQNIFANLLQVLVFHDAVIRQPLLDELGHPGEHEGGQST